jgi:hypothetical protein
MGIARRVLTRIEALSPIVVLFVAFVCGVLLILGAFALHLNAFTDSVSSRQFGYVKEINWGFNYVLIIPVALFFAAATMNSINTVITGLSRSHMLVTKAGIAIDEANILESWRACGRSGVVAAAVLSLIGILVSGYEWLSVCLLPAIHHSTKELMPGWNIAWSSLEGAAKPVGCAVFGFAAYTAQAAVATAFLFFTTLLVAFAKWVFDYTKDSTDAELFPNPSSDDDRRGFENFEPLIENLLLGAVFFFFVFFMTRLDALYVYSSSPSISAFVSQNIFLEGFSAALKSKGAAWLFDFGDVADASTTLVGAGFCLVAVLGFLVPSVIVFQAAKRSKQRFLSKLQENPAQTAGLYGMTPDQIKKSVGKMVFWPIHYPKLQLLLVFVVFSGICFVCYRLTLTILLMLLIHVVRQGLSAMGLLPKKAEAGKG